MKKSTGNPFAKFAPRKSNAAIKEQFRQEKKKAKKEREEYFEKKKAALRNPQQQPAAPTNVKPFTEKMPLNKFIAHGGIAARREAAELVKSGLVKVNGAVVNEPGYKVSPADLVTVNGKKVQPQRSLVYILMNKPKDYITTTDDPQKRKTVIDLLGKATKERIYPVGRLDRNTTGVLLLTNDGDLAQQLTHPSHQVRKIYQVTLDKPLEKNHFTQLANGVVLEDGPVTIDAIAYSDPKDKRQLGVEIHSGRNRIVRRLFEHVGYDVKNLDRVLFAGLTKKNVDRGKWRFLTEKEVRLLKHFGNNKKDEKRVAPPSRN
ncbi:MAG: rRNA pseudouridine synthase [Bacteroidetes bacterium]|nr:rRNA pseudouridine synthase [Bacteroidota bacterium]